MKLRKLLVLLLLLSAAFILSACGKQGIQGETGDAGLKGETGAPGDKGPTGDVGDPGAKGEDGANGVGIQFSYGSEGLLWRYIGETDWNAGVAYADIFAKMDEFGANGQANANAKAASFDYYVAKRLSGESAGASVKAYDKTFTVGTDAFGTIGAALEAAKTAAAAEGYKGLKIFVDAGEYEEYLVVEAVKSITCNCLLITSACDIFWYFFASANFLGSLSYTPSVPFLAIKIVSHPSSDALSAAVVSVEK